MSTYLVAFVVSDFKAVKAGSHNVYARSDFITEGRADYALKISNPIMDSMIGFTNISYKMEKMTQIAIPDAWFAAGAMENWGLVTYKERYILYKNGVTTSAEKQRIAAIVAHEYGHQWFGNLVSPEWWTYIWLNEGFATYFEFYASDLVEPTMRMMEQFVTTGVQYALELDSVDKIRPISFPAQSPEEISALFDVIAYDKGIQYYFIFLDDFNCLVFLAGSVIRMMEHFVTTEVLKTGLNKYLTARYLTQRVFVSKILMKNLLIITWN